ncbi:MAG: CPBP family intramembrane metalloprotease [Clostridiales bacterium]|nr:CPBP family intramembrane metalloprotease [Clostridiales bacterium]
MRKIFSNRKYRGFVWHLLFAALFIGLSLLFLEFTSGVTWFLISSLLRIIFGVVILLVSSKLYEKKPSQILSVKNTKGALLAGVGFLVFFLYYVIVVASGMGKISGLTAGILLSRIILQQATTGFYEELNYRFMILEGFKYTRNTTGIKVLYVFISTVLFGLLHCVTGWSTYTFLQTGAIGFAFAVIFVKSGNIVVPMILHFIYDVIANMTGFIVWDHNPFFDNISAIFEIMLVLMVVISAVTLVMPVRRAEGN